MRAVVCTNYGPPDVLQLKQVAKPVPMENEVLIKIHAATVNTGDCEIRRFQINLLIFWILLRIMLGIIKPRGHKILGQEVAGEIEAVGKGVTQFKPGDRVMAQTGMGFGGYAEYVCLPIKCAIAKMPANMTWKEAAGVPVGGANALHFLRKANIQAGQKVLIYGSTGTIGTCAIQLAKYYGAEVTAVCSSAKIELVKSLGADKVIDYTKEDYSANAGIYDVVFDTIGKGTYSGSLRSLKKNGIFLLANPSGTFELLRAIWTSLTSSNKVIFEFADHTTEDLVFLKELIEAGKLTTVVDDNRFLLEQAADAHRYVEKGHKKGNVVITVEHGKNLKK